METNDRQEVSLHAQRMEVLGRLAGAVIHDLNNLLTVIQLNAGMIEAGGLVEDEVLAAAGKIDQAARRAADLTRKVLNFARGQADETGEVNLRELVISLLRLLAPLTAKRASIQVADGAENLWIHGNRGAIEQAVMNLVLNAVDSMPSGGCVIISFDKRDCATGSYAGIIVQDEGCGILLEDQVRIFEPFFTTKNFGTGMGLAIVDRIVRSHGGTVDFKSEPGKGTRFRLWFPESGPPAQNTEKEFSDTGVSLANQTVLLVEDDPSILALAQYLLKSAGLRVLSAVNGEEGWKLWEDHQQDVDLLFTDIVLPGKLSGRDLALRILDEKPSLPILYTSGYSNMGHDQSYCTDTNFLPKPFQPHALQQAVKLALTGAC